MKSIKKSIIRTIKIVAIINVCTMISKISNVRNISFDIYLSIGIISGGLLINNNNKFLITTVNQ